MENTVGALKENSELEKIIQAIKSEASRVRESKGRLCNLNDKLLGCELSNTGTKQEVSAPESIISQLNDALDQLKQWP